MMHFSHQTMLRLIGDYFYRCLYHIFAINCCWFFFNLKKLAMIKSHTAHHLLTKETLVSQSKGIRLIDSHSSYWTHGGNKSLLRRDCKQRTLTARPLVLKLLCLRPFCRPNSVLSPCCIGCMLQIVKGTITWPVAYWFFLFQFLS